MNIEQIASAYEAATKEFLLIASSVPENKLDVDGRHTAVEKARKLLLI